MSHTRIDVSKLTKSRTNVYFLSLHLLGLSLDEKESLDIPKLYKTLYGRKLKDDIHHELDQMDLPRSLKLQPLCAELVEELSAFAKSLTTSEIKDFFIRIVNEQIAQENMTGTIKLLEKYRDEASLFFTEESDLQEKSFAAWKSLISTAASKKSLMESYDGLDRNKTIAGLFVLIGILPALYALEGYLSGDERTFHRLVQKGFRAFNDFAPLMFFIAAAGSLRNVVFSQPDLNAEVAALNNLLDYRINQHMQNALRERYERKKELPTVKSDPVPEAKYDTDRFEEPPSPIQKLEKRKHRSNSDRADSKSETPNEVSFIDDKKNKTKYYRVNFHHLNNVFFKNKRAQLRDILIAAGEKDKATIENLLDKVETEVVIGRVLPSNSDKCGIVTVSKKEKAQFPSGLKLKIREDVRPELVRRKATPEEKELGIEEVLSPTGAKYHKNN